MLLLFSRKAAEEYGGFASSFLRVILLGVRATET
jgi:hypothetical protein